MESKPQSTGIFNRDFFASAWISRIISCHLLAGNASSFTLRMEPTPYSPTALRSFSGLIRMDWPCPSVTMPISNCVIWPIFSLSVICASSFSTAAPQMLAGGPAGVILRRKNVWLSTIPNAASSAPEGTVKTVQTASKITICQYFVFRVYKGVSLMSILPRETGYSKFLPSKDADCALRENCYLATCSEDQDFQEPKSAGV